MHLFVLDYDGTLTHLRDPIGFIAALRQKYTPAVVALYTGASRSTVEEYTPGLLDAIDFLWPKPSLLLAHIQALDPEVITIADDEPMLLSALKWAFRDTPYKDRVRFLTPQELPGLLTE